MGKIVAAFNMTLDGYCDHTGVIPDEEIHWYYTDILRNADAILYGRITYHLMEYWIPFVEKPSGDPAMDEFAKAIDEIPKIVFSNTLRSLDWKSARLAKKSFKEEILELKEIPGRDILLGSPSIILAGLNSGLLDELHLCIHPVILGKGITLFRNIPERKELKLFQTKTFSSGAVTLFYKPMHSQNLK